jgi:hypothetical protein
MKSLINQMKNFDFNSDEYKQLNEEKERIQKEWEAKQINLIRSILYAFALFLAFSLIVASAACPPLAIVGTILCFVFTLSHNFINVGMDLSNTYSAKEDAQRAFDLKSNELNVDKNVLTTLETQLQCQQTLFLIKSLQLFPVLTPQLLIPPLIFAALILAPTGVGFAVVVSALVVTAVLATAASFILKKYEAKENKRYKDTFFGAQKVEERKNLPRGDNNDLSGEFCYS